MKSMIGKLLARLNEGRKNNKGMTFVEVICAVAIFALVSTTIGGIIVVSVRTYRKGVSETSVQQEAQLAANNIGNIVKDACSVQYGESGSQMIQDGEDPVSNEDGSPKMPLDGTTELSIITNKKMQYSITYVEAAKTLLYEEIDTGNPAASITPQIMAKNIKEFRADTADFKESRTIKLNMTVEDESTGREFPMAYTMTSRNEVSEDMTFVSTSDAPVIIFLESDLIMVPGETYSIPIAVIGKLTQGLENGDATANVDVGAVTTEYVEVTIPRDTTATSAYVQVRTKDRDGDGNPKAVGGTNINIRKVNEIKVTYAVNSKDASDGAYETAGAQYIFYANVSGDNLAKSPGSSWDSGYKRAQAVYWSYKLEVAGNTYTYVSDQTGAAYSNQSGMEQYVKFEGSNEDVDKPSLKVKLMQNMPSDFVLTVTATSKHALGVNKASSRYPDDATVKDGVCIIKPRETKVDDEFEITLEPNETGEITLNMRGGLTGDVTFVYHDATDTPATQAVYDASTDKVKITLGRDEMGSGRSESGANYTFTIDVLVGGVKKSLITVHVCRIDEVSLEIVDNFSDKDGNLMGTPTYDFRARINVSNGKNDSAMRNAVKYLIQYKEDGSVDADAVANTLASRITWELIDNKNDNKILKYGSVVCKAGVGAGNAGEIIGSYDKKYADYYEIVNIKPARIEQDANGDWYLKQVPEIDISPNAKYDTGLPPDTELKVTVEMLHPRDGDNAVSDAYNKSNKPYKDTKVEANASIKGSQTIYTDTELIVVEPGQGTNESVQSDSEMVIPIKVSGGAVYRMEVELSGQSSEDTKLSSYQDKTDALGNHNPYLFNTAAGSNERTWLLGLIIGKDEKGKNGLIDVSVAGYNANNKVIATATFQLAVRRVEKVEVKVKDNKKITDVNKGGNVVTLEAYPTGYGEDGTEYYGIQKYTKEGEYYFDATGDSKPGNICRWETAGHGEYKSVLPMEWTMIINGKEKPLDQWTEYIEAGTVAVKPEVEAETDSKKAVYRHVVQFKLKQPLPNGAEIRATSLHTLGNVNDTKYNKSNKEYGKQYGVLKIGDDRILADGFKRAEECWFLNDGTFTDMRNYFLDVPGAKIGSFYRYSLAGKNEWTPYYLDDQNNWRGSVKFDGNGGSLLFMPGEEYDLDVVSVVYDENKKIIYWPLDSDPNSDFNLFAAGTGWGPDWENFKHWDGTVEGKDLLYGVKDPDGNSLGNLTPKAVYDIVKTIPHEEYKFRIPKTEMYFNKYTNSWNSNILTIDGKMQTVGSKSNPIHFKSGDRFAVSIEPTAFLVSAKVANFSALVMKDGQVLKDLDFNEVWSESEFGFYLNVHNTPYEMYNFGASGKGTYELRVTLRENLSDSNTYMRWKRIEGVLYNRKYIARTDEAIRNIPLYNAATGEGIIYFQVD